MITYSNWSSTGASASFKRHSRRSTPTNSTSAPDRSRVDGTTHKFGTSVNCKSSRIGRSPASAS